MYKILTIGGGSGQYALLAGLRELSSVDMTAVVSMVDSGGSTGRLRDELGILPPGDVLKCILALSPHRDIARTIFLKRFTADRRLKGHNAGNMLLTMLSRYTGSFPSGIQALAEILDVRGRILPVTIDKATLVAELTDSFEVVSVALLAASDTLFLMVAAPSAKKFTTSFSSPITVMPSPSIHRFSRPSATPTPSSSAPVIYSPALYRA